MAVASPACSNVFVSSNECYALQSDAQGSFTSLQWISRIDVICGGHYHLPHYEPLAANHIL